MSDKYVIVKTHLIILILNMKRGHPWSMIVVSPTGESSGSVKTMGVQNFPDVNLYKTWAYGSCPEFCFGVPEM
jgi:hypothetical protein